jgi:hypothetical protein
VFYSTFLPVVVGRSLLKKLVADKDTVEEVATISDEALTLLGLENYGDRWDDIFTRCEGDVRPYGKGQEMPEEHKSTVPTKYTHPVTPTQTQKKKELIRLGPGTVFSGLTSCVRGLYRIVRRTPSSCPRGWLTNVALSSPTRRPVIPSRRTRRMPTTTTITRLAPIKQRN